MHFGAGWQGCGGSLDAPEEPAGRDTGRSAVPISQAGSEAQPLALPPSPCPRRLPQSQRCPVSQSWEAQGSVCSGYGLPMKESAPGPPWHRQRGGRAGQSPSPRLQAPLPSSSKGQAWLAIGPSRERAGSGESGLHCAALQGRAPNPGRRGLGRKPPAAGISFAATLSRSPRLAGPSRGHVPSKYSPRFQPRSVQAAPAPSSSPAAAQPPDLAGAQLPLVTQLRAFHAPLPSWATRGRASARGT